MKLKICVFFLSIFIATAFISTVSAQKIQYPPHRKWDSDSLGNQRAVLSVSGNQSIAKGKIEWRRRDAHPEKKKMILVDATNNKVVENVHYQDINSIYCILSFAHKKGHQTYYLYYLPFKHKGSIYYPKDYYPEPTQTASKTWLATLKKQKEFAIATLIKLEAVTPFNSFAPMELIASKKETKELIAQHAGLDYLVFPEDRMYPIKMNKNIPYRWVKKGVNSSFEGTAQKGAYYAFQLGIFADKKALSNVNIHFADLKNGNGQKISNALITCINTNGTSYTGKSTTFKVDVPKGNIQSMWCYIKVPKDIKSGVYKGIATVSVDNATSQNIQLKLKVLNKRIVNHGVDEPWKMTRLPWLNSSLFQKNKVIPPYTNIQVQGNTLQILGRKVILDKKGLPAQIQTFFPIEMTGISHQANDLLAKPIRFNFEEKNNQQIKVESKGIQFTKQSPGTAEWQADNSSNKLRMLVKGHLEFDGFLSYQVQIIAKENIKLEDIKMLLPIKSSMAKYFMGLGRKGGTLSDDIRWKWDVAHKNQDGGWIGTVNGGLKFSLRDEHYERPLNTNFYLQKPLLLPTSWGNGKKGGINISSKQQSVLIDAYSGSRRMKAGDTLCYNFNLLITPFHPLYTDWHWEHRYLHDYRPVDSVKALGANVINIHQGKYINPYINYPFIATKEMKAYIDSAHQLNMDVKIYNTIRELANRAYELYPLMSLGHEIFPSGNGGGYPWLQEHLNGDYIAGWYTPSRHDASIVDGGMNRWHNYYVEGLNWLVDNVGIDGLYLDDVAYDRTTMKRVKRALIQHGHPGILDLHSANQYNKNDGWNNSANLYMPLFPYLNRLWFGEYFDYENNGPDFFMTEVSGIPFGLMGEMLQDGGNAWRGMLYGMTSRIPWKGSNPRAIWKVWDDFGIKGSQMIGYWVPDCPVKTDNSNVLVTVYKKKNKTLVSLASWAPSDTKIHLKIDWEKLGLDASKVSITAPEIKDFQSAATFAPTDAISVQKNKGWLLIIKE